MWCNPASVRRLISILWHPLLFQARSEGWVAVSPNSSLIQCRSVASRFRPSISPVPYSLAGVSSRAPLQDSVMSHHTVVRGVRFARTLQPWKGRRILTTSTAHTLGYGLILLKSFGHRSYLASTSSSVCSVSSFSLKLLRCSFLRNGTSPAGT